MQADQHPDTTAALIPVITQQSNGDFAIAWASDMGSVFMRFFEGAGVPKGDQVRVDADGGYFPAIASDRDSNVYVVWKDEAARAMVVRKYGPDGQPLAGPAVVYTASSAVEPTWPDVAVAANPGGACNGFPVVIVTWSDDVIGDGPITVMRQRLCANDLSAVGGPETVSRPPALPAGVNEALWARATADPAGNSVTTWMANLNDPYDWSAIVARSFGSDAAGLKNDFRIDLGPRGTSVREPGVARTSRYTPGKFVYAWRDNRAGHFDVYTRVVESVTQP